MPGQDSVRGIRPPTRHAQTAPIKRGRLSAFGSFIVVAALAVTVSVTRGPAHAADPPASTPPEDAAVWNPGQVTYQVDTSGCHTIQLASIDTATAAIADTVSANLEANKLKSSYPPDSGVKVTQINDIRKDGTHIDLRIDGWLSNAECAQGAGGSVQQTSLRTGSGTDTHAATHVLGTVDLTRPDQIRLVAASTWFKDAVKVVAVAVAWVAILTITLAVIGMIVAEGGAALAVSAQSALAGCVGTAAAELIAARLLRPEETATTKDRIAVAAEACIAGATTGAITARLSPELAVAVRRRLGSTDAVVGPGGTAAASQAGLDLTGLASMVDGVAEGSLRATQ